MAPQMSPESVDDLINKLTWTSGMVISGTFVALPAVLGLAIAAGVSYEPDPMAKRETLGLVRAYYKIEDAEIRNRLRELAQALGAAVSKDS